MFPVQCEKPNKDSRIEINNRPVMYALHLIGLFVN